MPTNGFTGPGGRTLKATAGLVAVIGAIVLGILGMHGLSQHASMPGRSNLQPIAATGVSDAHAAHASMSHAATAMPATATGDSGAKGTAGDQGGSVGDKAMLCAAMLLAAAAGVLLVLRLRRLSRGTLLAITQLPRAVTALVSSRLGTGPPAVWEFSVIRC